MIEVGSLVKIVNMGYDCTKTDKSWQNGAVGTVTNYTKTVNIHNGEVFEMCSIKLLVPFLSVKGNPITHLTAIYIRNLEEIKREPIKTP
jgi:hypothetical protein